jgi:hypothetical protein
LYEDVLRAFRQFPLPFHSALSWRQWNGLIE